MPDVLALLVMLLALIACVVPFGLCAMAFVTVRRWTLGGARPGLPMVLLARPLGLIGLTACVVICIAGFQVPSAALGDAIGNLAVALLMALAGASAWLGAAAFGQRRARVAGALAVLLGLVEWFTGLGVLFFSNVGMGMPGRPLRRRGMPLLPGVQRGEGRREISEHDANVTGLTPRTRRALARAWRLDARYEAASVPTFDHLARDLEVARAPAQLIARARRAQEDEAGHASLCFALASAYAGRSLGESRLPFAPAWVRYAETRISLLERLAVDSLVDGCMGEEAAALGAALGAARAVDPIVKRALERIALEEASHAELAWAIVDWALEEDPRLASVLSNRLEGLEIDLGAARERAVLRDLARHGRVSLAERTAHLARAHTRTKEKLAAGLAARAPREHRAFVSHAPSA